MTAVDVTSVIDRSRVGAFQVRLFVLCALCLAMAVVRTIALGYVMPGGSTERG